MNEKLLPGLIAQALLVPQQSESAQGNVHKLVECLSEESKQKVFEVLKIEMVSRLKIARSNIDQQIEQLEEK